MSTTQAIIGIALTIYVVSITATYLIGRYFRSAKIKELEYKVKRSDQLISNMRIVENTLHDEIETLVDSERDALRFQFKTALELEAAPKFQVVANKEKHPAANDSYLYIEGEINGVREAGLLTLSAWDKAKERLLDNPEDKPNV